MSSRRCRRSSIRLGTYTHDQQLVRIHPALDQPEVPRFFVAFVVFHELLHHVVPAERRSGRIDYHPPAFRKRGNRWFGRRRSVTACLCVKFYFLHLLLARDASLPSRRRGRDGVAAQPPVSSTDRLVVFFFALRT